MKKGNNGVSAKTIENIQFGAGTIHKGLKYTTNTWNFDESCVGATKGGSSLKITPSFYKIEPDGSTVAIKQFNKKIGEVATLEVNFLELTKDLIKSATIGQDGTSADTNFDLIESKDAIAEGDYWDNIAFVGETADGENIIVILDNALCTSGLALDSQNNAESVGKYTFECHADADQSLTTLPWHIYYPKRA
jgi:hypothetical protein